MSKLRMGAVIIKAEKRFYNQQGAGFTHCPDCETRIKDEFPKIAYVGCSGCPRIFERTNWTSI